MLDAGTASKNGFEVGDTIRAAGAGPADPYTITGVATYGSIDSLGGASLAIFDLPTAQKLFKKQGQYDSISVKATDGVVAGRADARHQAAAAQDAPTSRPATRRPRRTPRTSTRA